MSEQSGNAHLLVIEVSICKIVLLRECLHKYSGDTIISDVMSPTNDFSFHISIFLEEALENYAKNTYSSQNAYSTKQYDYYGTQPRE